MRLVSELASPALYHLPDPADVVADLGIDTWFPRLAAHLWTPRHDALKFFVADEGSPRIALHREKIPPPCEVLIEHFIMLARTQEP